MRARFGEATLRLLQCLASGEGSCMAVAQALRAKTTTVGTTLLRLTKHEYNRPYLESANGCFRTLDHPRVVWETSFVAGRGELTPVPKVGLPRDVRGAARQLLESWLRGRKDTTLRTYGQGMDTLVKFLVDTGHRVLDHNGAAALLFGIRKGGPANKLVLDYKNWLMEKKYSASTVNLKLAAISSLTKLGRTLGLITWEVEIRGVKVEAYRDTRGPGIEAINGKILELWKASDAKSVRDCAILCTLGVLGFRRGETVAIDMAHLNQKDERLFILGKGRHGREPVTVPAPIMKVFQRWIGCRGARQGAFFVNFDRARKGGRLTARSVARITEGHELGRPHGLRHASITEALDKAQGDVRKVARFSRHRNIQTLLKYDDNRRDLGGDVAKGLADGLGI